MGTFSDDDKESEWYIRDKMNQEIRSLQAELEEEITKNARILLQYQNLVKAVIKKDPGFNIVTLEWSDQGSQTKSNNQCQNLDATDCSQQGTPGVLGTYFEDGNVCLSVHNDDFDNHCLLSVASDFGHIVSKTRLEPTTMRDLALALLKSADALDASMGREKD